MNAYSSIDQRMTRYHMRFAFVEVLVELIVTGWRAFAGWIERIAENRCRDETRRQLRGLSDHFLKDIGLDRRQIDRLFS